LPNPKEKYNQISKGKRIFCRLKDEGSGPAPQENHKPRKIATFLPHQKKELSWDRAETDKGCTRTAGKGTKKPVRSTFWRTLEGKGHHHCPSRGTSKLLVKNCRKGSARMKNWGAEGS